MPMITSRCYMKTRTKWLVQYALIGTVALAALGAIAFAEAARGASPALARDYRFDGRDRKSVV